MKKVDPEHEHTMFPTKRRQQVDSGIWEIINVCTVCFDVELR